MSYKKKFIKLSILGSAPMKAEHVLLRKGKYIINPHPRVLCPWHVKFGFCTKNDRPQFLTRNYGDPNLELWFCPGCDFIIRVEKNG